MIPPSAQPPTPARLQLGVGLGLGLFGHGIAWLLYWLLEFGADSPALPAWATLAVHFGGREVVLAVFALASTLWIYAGMGEQAERGFPRVARAVGLFGAIVIAAYAYRWYSAGRPVLAVLGALAAVPGLLGPAARKAMS